LEHAKKITLSFITRPSSEKAIEGLIMELKDGAYELIQGVDYSYDYEQGFKDVDVALLCGAMPRGPGMERKDLLQKNKDIFEKCGLALNASAKRTCKVVVIGNPANTNCLIAQ
jgi:malate/lactate dehydrogenase